MAKNASTNVVKQVVTVIKQGATLVIDVMGIALDALQWVFNPENWKLLLAAFDGSMAAIISWFKDNIDSGYISNLRAKFKAASAAEKAEMVRNKSYQILRLGE